MLFDISSKFDLFICVDMVMCHALICVNDRSKILSCVPFLKHNGDCAVFNVNQHCTKMSKII